MFDDGCDGDKFFFVSPGLIPGYKFFCFHKKYKNIKKERKNE